MTEASGLLKSTSSFEFIISLIVVRESPRINVLEFKSIAHRVYDDLSAMRHESKFTEIMNEAKAKAQEDGLEVPTSVKRSRRDVEGEDIKRYYRRALYFASLDELLTDFKRRILGQNAELTSAFGVFSHQSLYGDNTDTDAHLETLANVYGAEPNPRH